MARASRRTRRNFDRAARKMRRLAKRMKKPIGQVVFQAATEIVTDVSAPRPGKGVPRELGDLARSARVAQPDAKNRVKVSYGGPAAPYALVQHERLDYSHDLGEARYLVRGVERWKPDGSAAVAALKANTQAAILAVRGGA